MLNEKEEKVKDYLIKKVVPTLEKFIEDTNHAEFNKWSKNCCNQTAFVNAYVLKQELPDYTWEVKEWIFKWERNGQLYNHAFVTGKSKKYGNMLVDLSRHPIWNDWFIKISSTKRPYEDTDIHDEVIKEETRDFKQMLVVAEYFTKMKGEDFAKEVIKRANLR